LCTFCVSAFALLFAQGRMFQRFLSVPLIARFGNGCLYWSIPGVTLEFATRGFYSSGTVFSDLFIMVANATLYAIPLTLLLRWRGRRKA
jgi:hypothetical protein